MLGGAAVVEGVVFYQAGIVVLSSSVFANGTNDFYVHLTHGNQTARQALTGAAISGSAFALRHRIKDLSYNNTTEINSKIYFCRVPHNKYNYSSNPTYTNGSKIRVKEVASDTPRAYITTIGLYNSQMSFLATAKLSEPMKDPSNELILRVRLDY